MYFLATGLIIPLQHLFIADLPGLQALEKRLGEVRKELNQIELTAGTAGIADMAGYEKLMEEQAKLRDEIAELYARARILKGDEPGRKHETQ